MSVVYLVTIRRAFDCEPVLLFQDRDEAIEAAQSIAGQATSSGPKSDRPRRGRGELEPTGLLSQFVGVTVTPFVDGKPDRERSIHF